MGLLFRPRCPPSWAADNGWFAANAFDDVVSGDSGDAAADLEQLARDLARAHLGQADAFSDIELFVDVELVGGTGYAEWVLMARHTGRLVMGTNEVEPTGARVTLRGVTVADVVDGRLRAPREYVDDLALLDDLGLLPEPDRPIS